MLEKLIEIKIDQAILTGIMAIPAEVTGIVLFAHGSGSSRLSPRNNFVANILQQAGFATLLIDLLTLAEDKNYATRFDIELLTKRLIKMVHWLEYQPETKTLPIGIFGASTGAAAALMVAAELGSKITAIVSRGGRPDLAIQVLPKVISPTLLIVGGDDFEVLELNQQAYQVLSSTKSFEIIKGATHLFEEPGSLEKVAELAKDWFGKHFSNKEQ